MPRSSNPCPCGWWGSGRRDCRCDDGAIARYAARISGPLLDRVDLQVGVLPVAWRELDAGPAGPSSREVGSRVLRVGRTIADLAGEKRTGPGPIAEALGYRDDWSGGVTRTH